MHTYFFKYFVEFMVGETVKLSFHLFGIKLSPEDLADVFFVEYPWCDLFFLFLFLDDNVGSVDFFFLQFVGLHLFRVSDVGSVLLVA